MKRMMAVLVTLLMLFGTWNAGLAQELAQVRLPVIVEVPQLVILEVNRDEIVFAASDFQDPEQAEVTDEGITVTKRQALNVQAFGNLGYQILISTLAGAYGGLQGGGGVLPTSQLQWRVSQGDDGDNGWSPLPIEGDRAPVMERRTPGRLAFDLDFRLFVTWEDSPDNYEGTILFTVVPAL